MLLTALKAYGKSNLESVLPDFYDRQEVRYRIDLDSSGKLLAFDQIHDCDNPSRGIKMAIPLVKRSGTCPPPFILDKGDYMLGIPPKTKSEEEALKVAVRTPGRHRAYLDLLETAVRETQLLPLSALFHFATNFDPIATECRLPKSFDASSFIAVYVNGQLVTDDPRVMKWWADRQTSSSNGTTSTDPDLSDQERRAMCGVCGRLGAGAALIPVGIRGLSAIGGTATMALISGNDTAFERHGMPRASGAAICLDCGTATHQALNSLIADPTHSKRIGSTIFVWWATEDCDDYLSTVLDGYSDGAIGELLSSISSGRLRVPVDTARFYAVALGASEARVVLRSWTDATIRDTQDNIAAWFHRVQVVDWDGSIARPPGLFRLLASLAPPGSGAALGRIDPALPTAMLEAALQRRALPRSVLSGLLSRLRAEGGNVTALRAALLKACLVAPDHPNLEDNMTSLDHDNTDPAYLCGRLLATLDDAARLATSANNSLVDHSYASASTMPAVTFTRLLRLHRSHLDKLKRDNPGAANRIDATVTEIMDSFASTNGIPTTLEISEQARFALGMYHQQASFRAASKARSATKTAATLPSNPIITTNDEE